MTDSKSSISTLTKTLPNFKEFLTKNNFDSVSSFLTNFVNFQNNISNFQNLNDSKIDDKLFSQELILFLNTVLANINSTDNELDTLKSIERTISQYDIKTPYTKDLIMLLKEILTSLKKKNISSNLISMDWQLSMIEKENEKTSVNLNKFDKVEVTCQFKTFDNKEDDYRNNIVKMGYNEFFEIFQNLKKIDGQLHLFKN